MRGFVVVTDNTIYNALLEHGFSPFNKNQGKYIYVKNDRLTELLEKQFGKSSFTVSNKLTF